MSIHPQENVDIVAKHGLSFGEKLALPKKTWENYLHQGSAGRYSIDQLLEAAMIMEKSYDNKAKYCAASAYLEMAFRITENTSLGSYMLDEYSRMYSEKAEALLGEVASRSENIKEYIDSNMRITCLNLYRIPVWQKIYSTDQALITQSQVADNIDKQIKAMAKVLLEDQLKKSQEEYLCGAVNEYCVLRSLLQPELLGSGLIAVPSFPWEDRGKYPRNRIKNKNYDISLARVDEPTSLFKIQVKNSNFAPKLYEDDITMIYANKVIQELRSTRMQESKDNLLSSCMYLSDPEATKTAISNLSAIVIKTIKENVSR